MRYRYTPTESFSKAIKILLLIIPFVLFTMNVFANNVLAQQSGSVTTGPVESGNVSTGFTVICTVQGACILGPAKSGNVSTGPVTSGNVQTSKVAPPLTPTTVTPQAYSFIKKWGSSGTADGQFSTMSAVAVDSSGNVYVADGCQNNRIQKFNSNGTFITKWGSSGTADGQFSCPMGPDGVAVDPVSGNIYVSDFNNDRIQEFNSDGTFITKWGSPRPAGMAVDSVGNIYVTDDYNSRVQKFNSNGTFITEWGSNGTGDGQFIHPLRVAVDSSGDVYVADNCRVQKFSSGGSFITMWGSCGTADGQFSALTGIAVDSTGDVYVADGSNNDIQVFQPASQ